MYVAIIELAEEIFDSISPPLSCMIKSTFGNSPNPPEVLYYFVTIPEEERDRQEGGGEFVCLVGRK